MTDPIVTIQQGRSTWQGPGDAIPLRLRAAGGRKVGNGTTGAPEGAEAASGALRASSALTSHAACGDGWVSDLQVNDEGVRAVMLGLARELEQSGLLSCLLSHAIDLKLPFDLGVLNRELSDLILSAPVPASNAAPFGGINFSFCPLAYRRLAEATKDRVRDFVNRDGGGI